MFDKTVYRSQERLKIKNHDVYTEEVNKIVLSNNDDKRIQTFDGITTYPYGRNAFKLCKSEMLMVFILWKKLQWNSVTTINIKTINFEDYVNENKIEHNRNWPCIPYYPYRILITGGSGSGKTNVLLNLIENQPDIDKIYLYAKDPYEAKYQYLINIRKK